MKVHLLARPSFDVDSLNDFLSDRGMSWRKSAGTTDAEDLTEIAGRVCYLSFGEAQSPRTNREYVARLVQMGHESVLEHATWTLLMAGISRALSHQIVRHRAGFAFSQLSQQYHDESNAECVEPEIVRNSRVAHAAWTEAMEHSAAAYRSIVEALDGEQRRDLPGSGKEARRAIRSAARSVLPNAVRTHLVASANARAWRHFLSVRGSIAGDPEMRALCVAVSRILVKEAPALFDDFLEKPLDDGSLAVMRVGRGEP